MDNLEFAFVGVMAIVFLGVAYIEISAWLDRRQAANRATPANDTIRDEQLRKAFREFESNIARIVNGK